MVVVTVLATCSAVVAFAVCFAPSFSLVIFVVHSLSRSSLCLSLSPCCCVCFSAAARVVKHMCCAMPTLCCTSLSLSHAHVPLDFQSSQREISGFFFYFDHQQRQKTRVAESSRSRARVRWLLRWPWLHARSESGLYNRARRTPARGGIAEANWRGTSGSMGSEHTEHMRKLWQKRVAKKERCTRRWSVVS